MRLVDRTGFALLLIVELCCCGKIFDNCRFNKDFYQMYPHIFELNHNQTFLTVRSLYSLSNQTFSMINQSISIGIIYRFAETYLVPVPLVFQCQDNENIYSPNDCEFSMIDIRSDTSIRRTEPTRTTTVPLHFREYSSLNSFKLRGAYFKQSTVALENCRILSNENILLSNIFHLKIEFEQIIGSKCSQQCLNSQLYECSPLTRTCQCRSHVIEKFNNHCIDTELATNCSLTPQRCRRLCHLDQQIRTGQIDEHCQCPIGTRRIRINDVYHCQLTKLIECDSNFSINTCPKNFICRNKRCIQRPFGLHIKDTVLPLPFILIILLIISLLIILILVIGLLKMRSIKCVKFVHPENISSTHSSHSSPATITRLSTVPSSSSPCSTLSSSTSKSIKSSTTNQILEKYTKIDLFE